MPRFWLTPRKYILQMKTAVLLLSLLAAAGTVIVQVQLYPSIVTSGS